MTAGRSILPVQGENIVSHSHHAAQRVPALKRCPGCGRIWPLADVVASPELEPVGFQVNTARPQQSLVFFVHVVAGCHTTVVLSNRELSAVMEGLSADRTESRSLLCDGHFDLAVGTACREDCACRPHRELFERLCAARCRETVVAV